MVFKLAKSTPVYNFSKYHHPSITVENGSTIEIETYDCYEDQIQSTDSTYESLDWDKVNPTTGPIFVRGAERGDILVVTIDAIELSDQGVMSVSPGKGVLGDQIEKFETKIIPIRNNKAIFDERLEIPLNPMVGVIGVAPYADPVSNGTPGSHGGNMDNKMITTGTTLYFPVATDGALFALGDLHAAMGDGEVSVTGIEIAGKVTVTFDIIKQVALANPLLETVDKIATIASARTLDEAVKISVADMAKLLQGKINLSFSELTMLFSAVGQTEICQVVDPLMTARFVLPKWVLASYGVESFLGE
ncbi:acetamidase/formamidase family protein [Aquibacillus kalidii]|uniref:acetamidase/formamidase family protein n=1 Tax=Aquibacillus kalidii TaxID=2762597 RepID=UPI0016442150|nr:acetamidase/formamidase family protein [Aquibacillus kalidii]